MIFETMDFHPKVVFDTTKPTGVANRALDIMRARELIGWEPKVSLEVGLARTISWYTKTHIPTGLVSDELLMERRTTLSGPLQIRVGTPAQSQSRVIAFSGTKGTE
jgi:hypothetical protein